MHSSASPAAPPGVSLIGLLGIVSGGAGLLDGVLIFALGGDLLAPFALFHLLSSIAVVATAVAVARGKLNKNGSRALGIGTVLVHGLMSLYALITFIGFAGSLGTALAVIDGLWLVSAVSAAGILAYVYFTDDPTKSWLRAPHGSRTPVAAGSDIDPLKETLGFGVMTGVIAGVIGGLPWAILTDNFASWFLVAPIFGIWLVALIKALSRAVRRIRIAVGAVATLGMAALMAGGVALIVLGVGLASSPEGPGCESAQVTCHLYINGRYVGETDRSESGLAVLIPFTIGALLIASSLLLGVVSLGSAAEKRRARRADEGR